MSNGTPSSGQLFEFASALVKHVPTAFADVDATTLQGWIDDRSGAVAKALRSAFVPPISSEKGEVEKPVIPAIPLDDTYRFTVNRDQRFKAVVKAGKYDWMNDDITEAHFPLTGSGTTELEGILVHFNRYISTNDALAELDRPGLRPADFQELCAFGATHPEVQRKFPIVELASVWTYRGGYRCVAYLWSDADGRYLRLSGVAGGLGDGYRFLAFRKSQS